MRTMPLILALACTLTPVASWAAVDGDHDGRRDELREKLLAHYDTNHDGRLDQGERAAAKADIEQHRDAREAEFKVKHPELFAKIDADGDGKVDHGEGKELRDRREDKREDRREDHK